MIKDIVKHVVNEVIKRNDNQADTIIMILDVVEALMVSALFTAHVVTGKTKEHLVDVTMPDLERKVRKHMQEATTEESVIIKSNDVNKTQATNSVH